MLPKTLQEWTEGQEALTRARTGNVQFATFLFVACIVASIVFVALYARGSLGRVLEYEGVGLAGGLVGLAELVSRYRDQPLSAVTSLPALGYVAINALASLGALILIFAFDWKFGAAGKAALVTQLLVASFGAMALFRTSLFTIRAGGQDIGIGPSSLLSIILDACDRGVDRVRAKARAWEVARIMDGVSYTLASESLPSVASALMQNLSNASQSALSVEVTQLRQSTGLSDDAKALLLGLAIADQVGTNVLMAARLTLGDQILRPPAVQAPTPPPPATNGPPAVPVETPIEPDQQPEPSTTKGNGEGDPLAVSGLPQTPQTP